MHTSSAETEQSKKIRELAKGIIDHLSEKSPAIKTILGLDDKIRTKKDIAQSISENPENAKETQLSEYKEICNELQASINEILQKTFKIERPAFDDVANRIFQFIDILINLKTLSTHLDTTPNSITANSSSHLDQLPLSQLIGTIVIANEENNTRFKDTVLRLVAFNKSLKQPSSAQLLKALDNTSFENFYRSPDQTSQLSQDPHINNALINLLSEFRKISLKNSISEPAWLIYCLQQNIATPSSQTLETWLKEMEFTDHDISRCSKVTAEDNWIHPWLNPQNHTQSSNTTQLLKKHFERYVHTHNEPLSSLKTFYHRSIDSVKSLDANALINCWIKSWRKEGLESINDLKKHPYLKDHAELANHCLQELQGASNIKEHFNTVNHANDITSNIIKTILLFEQSPPNSVELNEQEPALKNEELNKIVGTDTLEELIEQSNKLLQESNGPGQIISLICKTFSASEDSNIYNLAILTTLLQCKQIKVTNGIITITPYSKSPRAMLATDNFFSTGLEAYQKKINTNFIILKDRFQSDKSCTQTLSITPQKSLTIERFRRAWQSLREKPESELDNTDLFKKIQSPEKGYNRTTPFSDIEISIIGLIHSHLHEKSLDESIGLLTLIQQQACSNTNAAMACIKDALNGKFAKTADIFQKLIDDLIGIKNLETSADKVFVQTPQASKSFLIGALGLIAFTAVFFPSFIALMHHSTYSLLQISLISSLIATAALFAITATNYTLWRISGIEPLLDSTKKTLLKPLGHKALQQKSFSPVQMRHKLDNFTPPQPGI